MTKLFLSVRILLLVFIAVQSHLAQFNDYSIKYGIQSHILMPRTEFDTDSYRLSMLGRGFLRFELNSFLESEIGMGIGYLNGSDFLSNNWGTALIPADLRLLVSPFKTLNVNPYLYAGFSMMNWNVTDLPKSESPRSVKLMGWTASIPIGAGLEVLLSEEIILDISGGYTKTYTDNLNFYSSPTSYDGFFNIGIGITFVMGGSLTDYDQDGLTKKIERSIGTDFTLFDSDTDKLSDGDEVNLYNTDPLNSDSDSDGLTDFEEIKEFNSDPNSSDTDGDNIKDSDEVYTFKTDPNKKDSDLDNLSDGYEINLYGTNPSKKDTDSDKLNDNDEIQKYKTDPLQKDTDGDGISDGVEVMIDITDPLDKLSLKQFQEIDDKILKLKTEKPQILRGISFELNKAYIKPESEAILEEFFLMLKKTKSIRIEIRGYTDNSGDSDYNKELSQKRADAVKLWLVKRGIDALRIVAIGFGELYPVSVNDTPEGRERTGELRLLDILNNLVF